MRMRCIKRVSGFTVGKTYKLINLAGELLQLKDDNGKVAIVYESHFEIVD